MTFRKPPRLPRYLSKFRKPPRGYAKDYVEAMWFMLQQEQPDDYDIATGGTYTIGEFLDMVFGRLELD